MVKKILHIALALLFFSVGYWFDELLGDVIGNVVKIDWPGLFYSLGMMILVVVTNKSWIHRAGWIYPDNDGSSFSPPNPVILLELIFAAILQLGTIFYTSWIGYRILGAVTWGVSLCEWLEAFVAFTVPDSRSGSDPAGAGMGAGFRKLFHIFMSGVIAILFFLLVKYFPSTTTIWVLTGLIAVYLFSSIIIGYHSRTVGRFAKYWREKNKRIWRELVLDSHS